MGRVATSCGNRFGVTPVLVVVHLMLVSAGTAGMAAMAQAAAAVALGLQAGVAVMAGPVL